jgi:DNA-binding NarL/FixJ family response regulator
MRTIRVAVLDRYPAVRAGIEAIVTAHRGLSPAGAVADEHALWPLLYRARPDVLLLGHHPDSSTDLALCVRVKARPLAPRVVIYAGEAGTDMIVPATLAGADAIVDKTADVPELVHAIRAVARGERTLPRLTPCLQAAAAARLAAADRAIFAMRLAGTRAADIAAVAGLDARALDARVAAIVAALETREGTTDPRRATALEAAVTATGEAA